MFALDENTHFRGNYLRVETPLQSYKSRAGFLLYGIKDSLTRKIKNARKISFNFYTIIVVYINTIKTTFDFKF